MNSPISPSPPRVLITGATGFVGRELMSAARSFGVRAALRSGPLPQLGAESVLVGDIDGRTDWTHALDGIECVVHLAARVHVMNPTPTDRVEFERTNVAGTERLASAAARAGVKRFVFLSSIKVNGETTIGRPFRANDPPHPQDEYGRSKLEAELRLSRIGAASAMRIAIVRPPLVYGPGVRANFLRLLSWAYRAAPLPLAAVKNVRSMISVWNLCDLICALLRRPTAVDGTYLVSDGEDISTPQLIRRLADSMDRPVRLFPLPLPLLSACATLAGKAAEFGRLSGSLTIDMSDTLNRLDWSPPVTLEQGLALTTRWYLQSRRTMSKVPVPGKE